MSYLLAGAHEVDLTGDDVTPRRGVLEAVEQRGDDVVWIRYRVV